MAKLLTNMPNFCQQKMNTNTIYYLTRVSVSTDFNLSPNLPLIYSSEQLIKSLAF